MDTDETKPFPGGRVGRLVVGTSLTTVGLLGLVLPILPGWALIVPGLGIMAPEIPRLRPIHGRAISMLERFDPTRAARMRRRGTPGIDPSGWPSQPDG